MAKPTAMELLDWVGCKDGNMANQTEAGHILAARVERVLALHENKPGVYRFFCQACEYRSNIAPCPTVRLLNGEEE